MLYSHCIYALIIVSCSFDVRMYSRRKAARTSERANERTSERRRRALSWANPSSVTLSRFREKYIFSCERAECVSRLEFPTYVPLLVRSLVRLLVGSFGKSLANLQAFQRSIFIYFYVESSWKLHRVKADLWISLKTNETKHSLYDGRF